jgi:DNA polymerase-3 subunit epsilon
MREIVLDTETTGLNPSIDRLVEIACLELANRLPTGRRFQAYLNPQCPVPEQAFAVHGLSNEFLADKPLFGGVAEDFLVFIGEDRLVIHNAEFDLGFINAELKRVGREPLPAERALDTVQLARRKFPGAQASLDALCRRFGIDNSARDRHGALLDAELLADVYLELAGGRQGGLDLMKNENAADRAASTPASSGNGPRAARPHAPTAAERAAHDALVAKLTRPIWRI